MTLKSRLVPGLVAFALTVLPCGVAADTAEDLNETYVVSQDESFGFGILIPADRIPPGVRVISYADYVSLVRQGGLPGRKLALTRQALPSWSIGVFR